MQRLAGTPSSWVWEVASPCRVPPGTGPLPQATQSRACKVLAESAELGVSLPLLGWRQGLTPALQGEPYLWVMSECSWDWMYSGTSSTKIEAVSGRGKKRGPFCRGSKVKRKLVQLWESDDTWLWRCSMLMRSVLTWRWRTDSSLGTASSRNFSAYRRIQSSVNLQVVKASQPLLDWVGTFFFKFIFIWWTNEADWFTWQVFTRARGLLTVSEILRYSAEQIRQSSKKLESWQFVLLNSVIVLHFKITSIFLVIKF